LSKHFSLNAKLLFIFALSPLRKDHTETIAILQYADEASIQQFMRGQDTDRS